MRKRLNQLIFRSIALFLASLVLGVILYAAIAGAQFEGYFSSSLVDSEVVVLMLVLCVLLVLALFMLLMSWTGTTRQLMRFSAWKKQQRKELVGIRRFSMLNRLDEEADAYQPPVYENKRSLREFCEGFRNYAAGKLGLYYDIEDIRRFVAGLGVTRLIILQGMSGTGKTSLAYAFGKYIENDSEIVPVQPMWKERSDIVGYFNEFTKKFNETGLLRKMYEAGYKREMYITVLDEVNISRIEYYFAEFLSLLELPDEEKRYLEVVSDVWNTDPKRLVGGKVKLPPNMWFIGTANNDDSTFAISDKVYDRAMVLNLEKKSQAFEAEAAESAKMSYERFCTLIKEAKQSYALSEKQEENIRRLDEYLIDRFHLSFGNRIMKQIYEYVPIYIACGGTELDALDDIFSKKVLRKLETQSPTYVRSELPALVQSIESIFGMESLPQCSAYLQHLSETMA